MDQFTYLESGDSKSCPVEKSNKIRHTKSYNNVKLIFLLFQLASYLHCDGNSLMNHFFKQ